MLRKLQTGGALHVQIADDTFDSRQPEGFAQNHLRTAL